MIGANYQHMLCQFSHVSHYWIKNDVRDLLYLNILTTCTTFTGPCVALVHVHKHCSHEILRTIKRPIWAVSLTASGKCMVFRVTRVFHIRCCGNTEGSDFGTSASLARGLVCCTLVTRSLPRVSIRKPCGSVTTKWLASKDCCTT